MILVPRPACAASSATGGANMSLEGARRRIRDRAPGPRGRGAPGSDPCGRPTPGRAPAGAHPAAWTAADRPARTRRASGYVRAAGLGVCTTASTTGPQWRSGSTAPWSGFGNAAEPAMAVARERRRSGRSRLQRHRRRVGPNRTGHRAIRAGAILAGARDASGSAPGRRIGPRATERPEDDGSAPGRPPGGQTPRAAPTRPWRSRPLRRSTRRPESAGPVVEGRREPSVVASRGSVRRPRPMRAGRSCRNGPESVLDHDTPHHRTDWSKSTMINLRCVRRRPPPGRNRACAVGAPRPACDFCRGLAYLSFTVNVSLGIRAAG
jgi:hypothetical protein